MKQLSINNILVIEDNRADAELIKEYLKEASFKYKMFHSPSLLGGIGVIEDKVIDLVLLDLSLDDTSGFGTLISYLNKVEDIPVIVLTGDKNATVGIRSVSAGAQDFLVKGEFSQQRLIDAIKYSIQRFKSKAKLKEVNYILKLKENRLKEAQKIGKFTNWEMNIVNNEMKWSPEMFAIFGYDQPTFTPSLSEYLRYVHIEDKADVDFFFSSAIKTGELTKVEHRILVNGRQLKYISLRAQIKYDEISNKIILLGNLQELSESKHKRNKGEGEGILLEKKNVPKDRLIPKILDENYNYFDKISSIAKSLSTLAATDLTTEQAQLLDEITESLHSCSNFTGSLHNLVPILNQQKKVNEKDFSLPKMIESVKSIFQQYNKQATRIIFEENYGSNKEIFAARKEIQNVIINLLHQVIQNTSDKNSCHIKIINRSSEAIRLEVEITYVGNTNPFSQIKILTEEKTNIVLQDLSMLLQKNSINVLTSAYLLQCLDASIKITKGQGISPNKIRTYFPIKKVQKKIKDGIIHSNVNVLLAEDHAMNQIVMRKRLTAWSSKIKITTVKTAAELLDALEQKNYDLIIMNVKFSDNGGVGIAKTFSTHPKYSTINIIGISSNPSEKEKEICMQAGMKIYMEKPFSNESLYGNVIQLLAE